ncbi:hypothetical protein CVO77_00985 [Sphingopyxis lindanitolerans]|uniref:DUF1838 domain-containing protein n=1 Tax=Sphingopyxis lindanitolerans TaxID=2054227 RepID=A0A2S8BAY3_9SPHN|nr:DUF1838 family protein [Sphingopyxis lindanitolerans]PQM29527.1 hypothetical protein CVO77_00985 [Sphingopyxis lindanitolerans]
MVRSLLLAGCAFGMAAMTTAADARILDPAKAEDALEIGKRTQCGIGDQPAVMHWSGKIYARVQGEPDRHLFDGEGMNIRRCVPVSDPKRGEGYRMVSREIMLFTDPRTGAILREWKNPWTGETVEVMHIANDPVNMRPNFPLDADGKPVPPMTLKRMGEWVLMPLEVPLFYPNPLAGAYQDYVGNQYHAMEIFDFVARADELLDTRHPTAYPAVSWVRLSDWMPWMKMGGRQGQIVFNAMGAKLKSYDELPKLLKDEIAASYPDYTAAPPADDQRPNATTWTEFKKKIDTERAARGPAAAQPAGHP